MKILLLFLLTSSLVLGQTAKQTNNYGVNIAGDAAARTSFRNALTLGTGDSPTFTGINLSGQTASSIVGFDASKNVISLSTATYPSLTELSYSKGVTSAIQTQLNLKAPLASPTFTGTVSGITKAMVGLSNLDNTSDLNKPISTLTQAALDLEAPLASPTFTGTVVLPSTSSIGAVSATELGYVDGATSALQTQLDSKVSLTGNQTIAGNKTFSGQTELTGQAATNSTSAMTRQLLNNYLTQSANIQRCPAFQGASSGTSLSIFTLNAIALGTPKVGAGDALSGYAYSTNHYAPSGFQLFGNGIDYGKKFKVAGSWFVDGSSASSNSRLRFFYGANTALGTAPTMPANSNMYSNEGVGFEVGYNSGNYSARIAYHDGTTYKTSTWATIHTGAPNSTYSFSFLLTNNGAGGVALTIVKSGILEGAQSTVSAAVTISVSDAPTTASANFESWVGWLATNDSATLGATLGEHYISPITIDTQQ